MSRGWKASHYRHDMTWLWLCGGLAASFSLAPTHCLCPKSCPRFGRCGFALLGWFARAGNHLLSPNSLFSCFLLFVLSFDTKPLWLRYDISTAFLYLLLEGETRGTSIFRYTTYLQQPISSTTLVAYNHQNYSVTSCIPLLIRKMNT